MPAPARHARYGPSDRYLSPPGAGMCISVFAIVRKGPKVLLGKPRLGPRWLHEWMPPWEVYPKEELMADLERPRLPCTYLYEGEHPDAALGRILADQLGMRQFKAEPPRVHSYLAPSDWYPGEAHWDLAFAYDVRAELPARRPHHWLELGWVDPKGLRAADFGWNADFVRDLGLVPRGPPRRAR
jgi:hypothetical protein